MGKSVYVKGIIRIKTKNFRCKELGIIGEESIPDREVESEDIEIYNEDLSFDDSEKSIKSSFFASYYSTVNIVTYNIGYQLVPVSLNYVYEEHQNEIAKIEGLLSDACNISPERKDTFYKCVYAGVFPVMESFIFDMLLYLAFSSEENFKIYSNYKRELKDNDDIPLEYENKVYDEIKKLVYHRLDKVKEKVNRFQIEWPSSEKIEKERDTRHHIVHRNGMNKEREKLKIGEDEVNELIKDEKEFIDALYSNLIKKIS